jgi:hypothetical protein
MKWFQLDADTPSDPRMRRVIRQFGNEGFGALVRIWCFVAAHCPDDQPGRAVDGSGKAYNDEDFADAAGLTLDAYTRLRDLCVEEGHFERESFKLRGEIFIPAMSKRADEFTRKRLRQKAGATQESLPIDSGVSPATVQDNTLHNSTKEITVWFEQTFWPAYPTIRRQAKRQALQILLRLKPDAALRARILSGLERLKKSDGWARGFVPMPTTFLNGHRWEDEAAGPVRPPNGPPPPQAGRTGAAPAGKYAGLALTDDGAEDLADVEGEDDDGVRH